MTTLLRMSPYVVGCFVCLDPNDAHLLPLCAPALRAVVSAFEAIDLAGALEHRTRCEASDPLDGIVETPGEWPTAIAATTAAMDACSAAFAEIGASAAALTTLANGERLAPAESINLQDRFLRSTAALNDAMYQAQSLLRAIYAHITNPWHVISQPEQSVALRAIDHLTRAMGRYAA